VSAHRSAPAGVRLDLPGAGRRYDHLLVDQPRRLEDRDERVRDETGRCPGRAAGGREPCVSAA